MKRPLMISEIHGTNSIITNAERADDKLDQIEDI